MHELDWCIVLLMAEGHQPLSEIDRLPVSRVLELATALQAYIVKRNALALATSIPPL